MENLYQKISNDPIVTGLVITIFIGALGWLWQYIVRNGPRIRAERREKKRRRYHAVIDSEEFVKWRDEVLKSIYGKEYFTHEVEYDFPVYSLECAEPLPYSRFQEFYNKDDIPFGLYRLDKDELLDSTSLDDQVPVYPDKRQREKYRKLLVKLKYPKLLGFTLDRYDMTPDGKITHVYPRLGKYEQTVYSSLILEYEMYEAYKKCKGRKNAIFGDWKRHLPLRSKIHDGHTIEKVLFTGVNRYSLLSVQGLIIFFDPNEGAGEWVTIIATRSNDVTAKAGYDQFPPAGGFELFVDEGDCKKEVIKENYSLRKAFFREYLEELFNKEEFGKPPEGGFQALPLIINDEETLAITDMIEEGKAHFELMGSAIDLVNLRHDLSFILRIDDLDFHRNRFAFNHEFAANKRRQRMPLKELDKNLNGKYKICQASVGLYNMVKKNHLYLELKENGFRRPSAAAKGARKPSVGKAPASKRTRKPPAAAAKRTRKTPAGRGKK